jgi:uncharacterized protein (DUF58 family)
VADNLGPDDMTLFGHRTRAQQLDDALRATAPTPPRSGNTSTPSGSTSTTACRPTRACSVWIRISTPGRSARTTSRVGRYLIETSATVTSILCGSHGDSGFGLDEARRSARAGIGTSHLNGNTRL